MRNGQPGSESIEIQGLIDIVVPQMHSSKVEMSVTEMWEILPVASPEVAEG